jgi:hypothetical protein
MQTAVDANEMLRQLGGAAAQFSYCPAAAFNATGDPLKPDAQFLENAAVAAEVRSELSAVRKAS